MKKHGVLWWVFIGWWWVLLTLPFRVLAAILHRAGTADLTEKRRELEAKRDAILRTRQQRKSGDEEPLEPEKELLKVAGTSFRQDAIKSLGVKNPNYTKTRQAIQEAGLLGKWIYEYEFTPQQVDLVPEPDNPHDRDAIKVMVDGVHIGYVKAEMCAHVHDILCTPRLQQVNCTIAGGKRKRYIRDGKEDYVLERDEVSFYARLTITTK